MKAVDEMFVLHLFFYKYFVKELLSSERGARRVPELLPSTYFKSPKVNGVSGVNDLSKQKWSCLSQ